MFGPKYLSAAALLFLITSGVRGADFTPGCSFVGGQCQYSVTLGHAGHCDSAGTGSGTTSGDSQCYIDLLQSQVKGLMNDLTRTRTNLEQAQTSLNQTEAERDALLVTLRQKEAELNTTQKELANLIHRTGAEITALRSELTNMTSQVDTCRTALGLPTVEPKLSSGAVNQRYCNFSSITQSPCKMTISNPTQVHLMTRASTSTAGPPADHSQGSVTGKYLALDSRKAAVYGSSASLHSYTIISEEFEPANDYCFFFYYSMVGKEVQDLDITVKVG
ncbi:hypothetical protein RRG08_029338 [Elysia crispata]|uniref:MAM domain-containing protein n=1 Tax=Elysia crispata TaxID=231223 RepID=A0AAE1ASY2_9GAST|nr:hypothetical protein RRG08_029338 [Elysia crispata]